MDDEKKVPEIRLEGFMGAWDSHVLGEIVDVRDGTHESPQFHQTGYPLVTSKNLTEYGLDMADVQFISKEDFDSINLRSGVEVGDIIFAMIGTIGNPVIIERADFAIKNVALLKSCGRLNNHFLLNNLKSSAFKDYVQLENVGNTQKFLSLGKIREYSFLAPDKCEQTAIGSFFYSLDTLITAQREELEKLQNIKSACLSKMLI